MNIVVANTNRLLLVSHKEIYHKVKRKFVSLKEMELEGANEFLICKFKGYDFEILSN